MTSPAAGGLGAVITDMIRQDGPLPIDRYMQLCLLHDPLGYYRRAETVGAAGDFITAPEVSQLFGELIGIWVAATWEAMGSPPRWRLIELGPGRGVMLTDMLRALAVLPPALDGLEVVAVEASPRLAAEQRRRLASVSVSIAWRERLPTSSTLPTILVANELLDALPIRQLEREHGTWVERCVGLDASGALRFEAAAPARDLRSRLPLTLASAPEEAIIECAEGAAALIDDIAALAGGDRLAALLIDYGYWGPATGDTLQAVRAHGYTSPLTAPGEADLSAHVDFAQVAQLARLAGLTTYGPLAQAELLSRLGIGVRLERLLRDADARTANRLEVGAARLMDPAAMGSRFRALALASKGLPRLPVF